jgi:diguanylate cyclase (GGDEF)-like protein/PAS domain S-box-containing protein
MQLTAWNPWKRMSFIARLAVTASIALIIASMVMLTTVAHEETDQVKASLDHFMMDQLTILPTTLADWIVVGDFAVIQELLNKFAEQHEVVSITYRSANGATVTSKGQLIELHSPVWFAARFGNLSPAGLTHVKIGGREYGTLEVTLTAHLAINQAWFRLQRHMAILALVVGLDFLGILMVLRNGLRPLSALNDGARALEAGDFKTRIPPQGNPELAHTIAAFNRMAESVETSQNTLRETLDRIALAASVFEHATEGILITDAQQIILETNPAFSHITGYSRSEVQGKTPRLLSSGRHDATFYAAMWKSILATGQWQGDIWNRYKNGEVFPERLSIVAVRDTEGSVTHYIGIFSDISELARKVTERTSELEALNRRLEALSTTDGLTGIANRRSFDDRLKTEWTRALRGRQPLALLMLDIDLFKNYNDHYGHQAGDECLRSVAKMIDSNSRRSSDLAARYGGEEFALIAADTDAASAKHLAEVIRQSIESFALPHAKSPMGKVTVSIGVSVMTPEGTQQPEMLIHLADDALYLAKDQGRNRVVLAHGN